MNERWVHYATRCKAVMRALVSLTDSALRETMSNQVIRYEHTLLTAYQVHFVRSPIV